jgi:carbon-monoxide dehydrogenase medium subunit
MTTAPVEIPVDVSTGFQLMGRFYRLLAGAAARVIGLAVPLPRFEYLAAHGPDEALAAWCETPDAAYLAGGTDLLPQMRAGRRRPQRLIDVKHLPGLASIRDLDDGGMAIGAAVPLADVEAHRSVTTRFPLLAQCCAAVGAPPLRNRATLAGNLCNASPAADTAVALLALDATVTVIGPAGTRSIPIATFFVGPGRTALAPGELLIEVVLPATATGLCGSYLRVSRRGGMDLATVGVLVARSGNGSLPRHRVALAAVAPTPLRVWEAEALLDRQGSGAAREAAAIACAACSPITDIRGSAGYRREMVGVFTRRAVAALAQEA